MESSRVPDDVIESIRSRISIVDIVSSHVALRRVGKNWKGLCPFHGEKTPSFIVNEERGTYHCFGCGAGGTAFRFLMEAEGRTFKEAVEILAHRAGVVLSLEPEGAEGKRAREERELLAEVLELACRYYRHQLLEGRAGKAARAYLVRRGINAEASEAFRLGCAPDGWDNLTRYLAKKGVEPTLASRAGLLSERASGGHYDRFRGRLVFPIVDASGRVLSFGGRVLVEGEPKYLNGPESPVFRKGEVLYGLYQGMEALRRDRRALVVEGYLDVVSLHSRGYRPALASLGTSLTAEHVQTLKRRANEAILIYDGDAAGRKAAFRSLALFLAEGFACRAVMLPPEHDPDSFVSAGGDLRSLIERARPLFAEFVDELEGRNDMGTVEGRLRAIEELAPSLRALSDPIARDVYFKEAAERFRVSEAILRERVATAPATGFGPGDARAPEQDRHADPVEWALLQCLVCERENRKVFRARRLSEWMGAGPVRDAAVYVADRTEEAGSLPIDGAAPAIRQILSQVLVDQATPRDRFEILETRLRLRNLEATAASIVVDLKRAEAEGRYESLSGLQQKKVDVARAIEVCKERMKG